MKINHGFSGCNHASLLVEVMPLQLRELSLLIQVFDHIKESCNLNTFYWSHPRSSENRCRKFPYIWKIVHYQPNALQLPDLHTRVRRANGECDKSYLTRKPDLVDSSVLTWADSPYRAQFRLNLIYFFFSSWLNEVFSFSTKSNIFFVQSQMFCGQIISLTFSERNWVFSNKL